MASNPPVKAPAIAPMMQTLRAERPLYDERSVYTYFSSASTLKKYIPAIEQRLTVCNYSQQTKRLWL